MKNLIAFLFCVFSSTCVSGQYISSVYEPDTLQEVNIDSSDAGFQIAQKIKADDFKKHLYVLASDSYEGREAGHPGIEKAANYIEGHLDALGYPKIGVENSYHQNIGFRFSSWKTNEMFVNGNRYKHLWDYLSFQNRNSALPAFTTDEVVFLGYGIDDSEYSDYKKNKVKDKVILIYNGEPIDKNGKSQVTESATLSDWDIDKKLRTAKKYGVKLVLIIEEDIKKVLMENRRLVLGNTTTLITEENTINPYANSIHISTTIANELIGDKLKKVTKSRDRSRKKGKARDIKLKTSLNVNQDIQQRELLGKNIMAYLEGTDKKDELVIVTAHYDHVGKKGDVVYNGADDNGSGTTALLEMTDAYMIAKKNGKSPRRSILFMWVTAEEKGLLGSQFYAENPVFPLETTVANVNVDMIGRSDEKYQGRSDYIYVIGSDRLSTDLHKINESVNEDYSRVTMDYTFNSESDPNRFYYRSDHYNFAKKGIPAIFFFSGVHEDYHQPGDTPDKIDYVKSERIARHISQLVWELANLEDRIEVDGEIK